MAKTGRPCKIKQLSKSKKTKLAYNELVFEIKKNEKGTMAAFLRDFNKRHDLDITLVNVNRFKSNMDGNVTVLKEEQKNIDYQPNNTFPKDNRTGLISVKNIFNRLEPKHLEFLNKYKENGFRSKEKAWVDAGFSDPKGVYDVIKIPEIEAALYEMKAVDYVNARVTGNQIIAGLGKIAHAAELRHMMYDEHGHLITDIREWPEELRVALNSIKENQIITTDKNGNVTERYIYEFKFESQTKAYQELRKHFVEMEIFEKNVEKANLYNELIDKLITGSITPVMALFEMAKESLPFKDVAKALLNQADLKQITEGPERKGEDLKKVSSEELSERLRAIELKKQKLAC